MNNWRNYFAKGGVQPYITNNPNDPRIQSYADSLKLYKQYMMADSSQRKRAEPTIIKKNYNPSKYIEILEEISKNKFKTKKIKNPDYHPVIKPQGLQIYDVPKDKRTITRASIDNVKYNSMEEGYGENAIFAKPIQEVILQQNKNWNIPTQGEFSTPEDYVDTQTPIITQPPTQILPKNDFRQYLQPRGFSRQGQGSESQSQSFYDANGKMTGQIINGQYVPTEYGKFLESGMSEDEYLNQAQEFRSGGEYEPIISASEQKYGIPKGLLFNIAKTESNFRDDIITGKTKSKVGAEGMFQFMPSTAKELGINPLDVEQSTDAAGKYLSSLYKQTGNWKDAAMAYNWGIGNVQKYKKGEKKYVPTETQNYIAKVFGENAAASFAPSGEYDDYLYQRRKRQAEEDDFAPKKRKIWEDEQIDEENYDAEDENTDENITTESDDNEEYISDEEMKALMQIERRKRIMELLIQNNAQASSYSDEWASF